MLVNQRERAYALDLDAGPVFVPEGFEVVKHIKGGILKWSPARPQIELYMPQDQRRGVVHGERVFEELEDFDGVPANANALDFFLNNFRQRPGLIPESWKKVEQHTAKHILFWGTHYRYEDSICVRTLDWSADARKQEWTAGYCWVDKLLNSQFPAAMVRKGAD
jgi:hypothetical protein